MVVRFREVSYPFSGGKMREQIGTAGRWVANYTDFVMCQRCKFNLINEGIIRYVLSLDHSTLRDDYTSLQNSQK